MKKQINFGVIGAGGIAYRKTIPGLLKAENCRLVAVMDPVGVEKIAEEFGAKPYQTESELLADPDVDAVYIASPVSLHDQQIKAAAQAGKHVLCEKPLTLNLQQAEEAVEICRQNKVFLQEGYMMKFHGAHRRIKELIEEGRLGKIVSMRAQLSGWYPKIEGAWRQDPSKGGGGALMDMATHLYDLLEFFVGPIQKIAALTGNLVQDYASEDASTTLLQFASGAQASVDCFFCIPDEASCTRLEIYGSRGSILTEGTIGQSVGGQVRGIWGLGDADYDAAQNKDTVRQFEEIDFEKLNPYTEECRYFADCILNDRRPEVNTGENAVHIMRLVQAAYESSKVDQMVEV